MENKKFPKRIAFNLIPQIDVFMEDGYTKEEWKMVVETKKILDPKIKLTATCVRVPVFISHSEAVNVEFEEPISAEEAKAILREAPGCLLIDRHEPGGYITPHEAAGEDATYISRVREDATVENGLSFWCVSDNLRKGAALNAVQIAEVLVNRGLIQAKAARRPDPADRPPDSRRAAAGRDGASRRPQTGDRRRMRPRRRFAARSRGRAASGSTVSMPHGRAVEDGRLAHGDSSHQSGRRPPSSAV